MPRSWTDKQERKYEHIVESEKDQGASSQARKGNSSPDSQQRTRAERREQNSVQKLGKRHAVIETRWPSIRHQSPKGPHKGATLQRGQAGGITGRSSMNKEQLRRAVDAKKR